MPFQLPICAFWAYSGWKIKIHYQAPAIVFGCVACCNGNKNTIDYSFIIVRVFTKSIAYFEFSLKKFSDGRKFR